MLDTWKSATYGSANLVYVIYIYIFSPEKSFEAGQVTKPENE